MLNISSSKSSRNKNTKKKLKLWSFLLNSCKLKVSGKLFLLQRSMQPRFWDMKLQMSSLSMKIPKICLLLLSWRSKMMLKKNSKRKVEVITLLLRRSCSSKMIRLWNSRQQLVSLEKYIKRLGSNMQTTLEN